MNELINPEEVKQDLTEKLSEKAISSSEVDVEEVENEKPRNLKRENIIIGVGMALLLSATLIYIIFFKY